MSCVLRPAVVARGAATAGAWVTRMVDLGVAASAGSWVELRSLCFGRGRSSIPDSGAERRMDVAVVYNVWWHFLLGGRWYGGSGDG